jgi:hypothetical protein
LKLQDKKENRDLKFIKEFNNIKISNICEEKNIDKSNVYKRGKYADEVKKEIDKKIVKLYNNYIDRETGDDDE